jgi:mRNA interferase MazF
VKPEYVPDAGQVVWLSPDPQRESERAGRRPFLVLSPRAYNAKTSLIVGVPITLKRKGYPFEVELPHDGSITGVILADRVKSLDWRARFADYAADAHPNNLRDVRALIATLLQLQ